MRRMKNSCRRCRWGIFTSALARTEKDCFVMDHADPNVIVDQADAYISALIHRVADDRLEILDGEGATRLVFVREAPLPGQPVDLGGTSWRLITDDDVDNDERVTTLIFNGRQVTGSTACRDYLPRMKCRRGVCASRGRACWGPLSLVRNWTAGGQVNSQFPVVGVGILGS